ncbi:MAG TPA: hypothetical protein VJT31_06690 [Rugosimonospora sp.]|nr:hypothetical protein [Rugosimonospora sp.]
MGWSRLAPLARRRWGRILAGREETLERLGWLTRVRGFESASSDTATALSAAARRDLVLDGVRERRQ